MASEKAFNCTEVCKFLMYVIIGGVCIIAAIYLLFNARSSEEPKIKNTGGQSELLVPPAPRLAAFSLPDAYRFVPLTA